MGKVFAPINAGGFLGVLLTMLLALLFKGPLYQYQLSKVLSIVVDDDVDCNAGHADHDGVVHCLM
eukprot:4644984-Amphidinium_carterae.1